MNDFENCWNEGRAANADPEASQRSAGKRSTRRRRPIESTPLSEICDHAAAAHRCRPNTMTALWLLMAVAAISLAARIERFAPVPVDAASQSHTLSTRTHGRAGGGAEAETPRLAKNTNSEGRKERMQNRVDDKKLAKMQGTNNQPRAPTSVQPALAPHANDFAREEKTKGKKGREKRSAKKVNYKPPLRAVLMAAHAFRIGL